MIHLHIYKILCSTRFPIVSSFNDPLTFTITPHDYPPFPSVIYLTTMAWYFANELSTYPTRLQSVPRLKSSVKIATHIYAVMLFHLPLHISSRARSMIPYQVLHKWRSGRLSAFLRFFITEEVSTKHFRYEAVHLPRIQFNTNDQ